MIKFFKFFFRGTAEFFTDTIYFSGFILILFSPVLLGVLVAFLLAQIINTIFAILVGIAIVLIGYPMMSIIAHSIRAVRYCKKTNTDSLDEAWAKTVKDPDDLF